MPTITHRVDRLDEAMARLTEAVRLNQEDAVAFRAISARTDQAVLRLRQESEARWQKFEAQAEKDRAQAEKDRQQGEQERKAFNKRMAEISD